MKFDEKCFLDRLPSKVIRKVSDVLVVKDPILPNGGVSTLVISFDDDTSISYKFGNQWTHPEAHKFMRILFEIIKVGAECKN